MTVAQREGDDGQRDSARGDEVDAFARVASTRWLLRCFAEHVACSEVAKVGRGLG
jgi:hypothetical protein